MARTLTGKVAEYYEEREQKNGDIYVYIRKCWYDPAIRNTRSKYELQGIKDPNTGKVVPTRPKGKQSALAAAQTPVKTEVKANGMLLIVRHFADISGVTQEVMDALPKDEGRALKILTLAWYSFSTSGRTWTRALNWTAGYLNLLPYHFGSISKDMYRDLFHYLGQNDGIKWSIFKKRAEQFGEGELVAWDSTVYKCGVADVHDARLGVDKDTLIKPLYKVFYFYSITSRQLISYVKIPGNIPDCATVAYAIAEMKALNLKKPEIIQDNGYTNDDTIGDLIHHGFHFISRLVPSLTWIQALIKEHKDALVNGTAPSQMVYCDPEFSGVRCRVQRTFAYTRMYKSSKKELKAGEKDTINAYVNVFLYYSSSKKGEDDRKFRERFAYIRQDLLNGSALDQESKEFASKYMTEVYNSDGVLSDVVQNRREVVKCFQMHGFLVLVADHEKDIDKVLSKFRTRETIEEGIKGHKSFTGGDTSKTGADDFLDGELLVEFLSNSMRESMKSKLRHMELELGVLNGDAEHDSRESINRQLALKKWIRKNSIANILDAFDTTEIEEVTSNGRSSKMVGSTVSRDRLFLNMLDIYDWGKA